MAELGQTTDPRQLIPGEPEQIAADLRAMVDTVRKVDATGDRLSRVDSVQWRGDASETFRAAYGPEPPKWVQVSEMLAEGGQSLADYGDTLSWGQGEAQRAIELYTQAQAATRSATAAHDTRVQFGIPVGPLVDPGAKTAQEAQEILTNAREKVDEAGTDAAKSLGFEPDGQGGFKTKVGDTSYGTHHRKTGKDGKDPGGWQKHKGRGRSYQGEWGSQSNGLFTDMLGDTLEGLGVTLPEATAAAGAQVEAAGADANGGFKSGPLSGDWDARGSVLGAGAEAHAGANPLGANAGASAAAYLGKGSAQGRLRLGDHTSASAGVEGQVGAHGGVDGTIGPLGGQAGGDVFAGADANGQASADLGGVSAGAHGGAEFGVGANASGQFGMGDDGKIHFGGSVGVALGPGFTAGFDISVDPGEVANTLGDAAKSGWHAAEDLGGGAVHTGGSLVKKGLHVLGIG
jgi:type VII secretion system ESX-1 substrate